MKLRILAPLLVLALLVSAPAIAQEARATPTAEPRQSSEVRILGETEGGRLEEVDGLKVLFLWGDLETRMRAEGYLLGDEILEVFEEFALSSALVPHPQIWERMIVPLVKSRFRFPEGFEAGAAAMLEGVKAKREGKIRLGALDRDLAVGDLLACSCIPDLAGFACSSFSAWGERTRGKTHLVGRNLDYFGTPKMCRNTLLRVQAPREGRRGWVGVGWPGFQGCLTGVSDRGVWVAIHDVPRRAEKGEEPFLSRVLALEEVVATLDPAGKPAERALEILRAARFSIGGNAMLAWASGEAEGSVVLEFDGVKSKDEGATARRPVEGVPFIACSNHHRLRSEDGHACWRFGRLAEGGAEASTAALGWDEAWKLISSSSVGMTLYRCVADLRGGRLEIDRRSAPRAEDFLARVRVDYRELLGRAAPRPQER